MANDSVKARVLSDLANEFILSGKTEWSGTEIRDLFGRVGDSFVETLSRDVIQNVLNELQQEHLVQLDPNSKMGLTLLKPHFDWVAFLRNTFRKFLSEGKSIWTRSEFEAILNNKSARALGLSTAVTSPEIVSAIEQLQHEGLIAPPRQNDLEFIHVLSHSK